MSLTRRGAGLAGLFPRVKRLTETQVLVGIPAENAAREPEPGETSSPLSNAALGYIHERGAPEANIPARPFLEPGIRDAQDAISVQMLKAGQAAAAGNEAAIDVAHHKAGLVAQNAVRARITEGPFEALAERTLRARRARRRTGTKPLIDTGQLRASISYVVRTRGR